MVALYQQLSLAPVYSIDKMTREKHLINLLMHSLYSITLLFLHLHDADAIVCIAGGFLCAMGKTGVTSVAWRIISSGIRSTSSKEDLSWDSSLTVYLSMFAVASSIAFPLLDATTVSLSAILSSSKVVK